MLYVKEEAGEDTLKIKVILWSVTHLFICSTTLSLAQTVYVASSDRLRMISEGSSHCLIQDVIPAFGLRN